MQGFSATITLIPTIQLNPNFFLRRFLLQGWPTLYSCRPKTSMGDRGSEYRAVAKDELEALEMTVSGEIQQWETRLEYGM